MFKSEKLKQLRLKYLQLRHRKGGIAIAILLWIFLGVPLAFLFSFVGQGLGWLIGQVIDFIPVVNSVAPYLANRCGDLGAGLSRHAMNVEFYQLSGAISWFWFGFWLPLKVAAKLDD